jgi:hypothetical protein
MRDKRYYSQRNGDITKSPSISLSELRDCFHATYDRLGNEGLFINAFGCQFPEETNLFANELAMQIHSGRLVAPTYGKLGKNIELALAKKLKKRNLWPICSRVGTYSGEDIFDLIEVLYEYCTIARIMSSYDGTLVLRLGDENKSRQILIDDVNEYLPMYEHGYSLTKDGKVEHIPVDGMESLVEEKPQAIDEANIESRISRAISLFLSRQRTVENMRDAVRELGDVLEYMKKEYSLDKLLLKKDSSDLFQILNGFGIRHHNPQQQSKYDVDIFYPWLFYYYLAAVRAMQKLLVKNGISA